MEDDTPLQEQLLKKIQELEVRDARLREEMAKLVRSGDSSGIDSPLNSSVQRPGPTSSFREIGEGHDDKTVPKWETGSASSRDKEGSILDYLNPISSNMSFTVKQSFDILQSMGQAIHVSDDKGRILYWNRAAEDLYGYSASEAIGRDVLHLIAEEQVYKDGKKIVDRSAMGESWTGLFPVINKQGRRFQVIATNSPLYDDCGTLIWFIGVTCDSQPFYETPTTFTSRRNPSREAAYPSSSQLSKSGPPATAAGLNSQKKSFQVTIASKLFTLTSRMTKNVLRWITRTRGKTMKYEIQGGRRPYVHRQDFLETVVSDPREYAQEKMYQERLFGDFGGKDESKVGVCKMITSNVAGVYFPWAGDAPMKRITTHDIYPSLNREQKDEFVQQKSLALANKVVKGYLFTGSKAYNYSSSSCSGNTTSSLDVTTGSSSSTSSHCRSIMEPDSLSYDILWGDLILGEQIGRGSCATVYHGLWCASDVAVKVFSEFEYSEDLLRTFRQEVLLMKGLRHPNVLLFMGALLRRNPPALDWKRRVLMPLDIARGLNYLHCYNPPIVHRDVKSSNLLVDNNWHLKVGDFGLSRLKHATFLTTENGNGTPQWMAPEVIRNEPADEKSDVYSFGVVLWELATGKIPWDGLIPMQVIASVGFMDQHIEIPDNTDPKWASLIKTCLHSDPKCRPTFGELLERLNVMRRYYFAQNPK
ncbi:hypothetical protein MKW98_014054 [Papaver atlanticum]|uniref:non-specific serine/threonine protein kinase n=1 Tax=Papaver atlanticum TaxID=357466 RepID=A0AAD4SIJ9_9MAGN|nr:hypothetical protein MKW98_014054 [Papaver atlanticum]